jgi:hypothetical protein
LWYDGEPSGAPAITISPDESYGTNDGRSPKNCIGADVSAGLGWEGWISQVMVFHGIALSGSHQMSAGPPTSAPST